MDIKSRLVRRLDRLQDHLAFVVSLHLFVENLIDALIQARSPTARHILEDHRSYPFSVKLTLVFHMSLLPPALFGNLRGLNSLRNQFAHEIDVDLAASISRLRARFAAPGGGDGFPATLSEIGEPGMPLLERLRAITFDWLHDLSERLGVTR